LRVFENKVLRRIFEPKKEEVVVGWSFITYRSRECSNQGG
jgi:hypothetical protein